MKKKLLFTLLFLGSITQIDAQQVAYFPDRNEVWKEKSAKDYKINKVILEEAVSFAKSNEYN